jgi:hypothetical protein
VLFDLQGKRRRVIQATYLALAILMGGGLVLFGVGSDVQGGLADIFTSDGGDDSGNPVVEEQLEEAQARLETNPDDPQALAEVARSNVQLATATDQTGTGALFAEDAAPRLEAAASAWEGYLETDPSRPDESLASLMIQVYGEAGLNEPDQATEAAAVVAEARPSAQAYLVLTQYAALAGDERQAALAGRRAAELAPASQREQVERQVKAIQAAARAVGEQGGAQGEGPSQ